MNCFGHDISLIAARSVLIAVVGGLAVLAISAGADQVPDLGVRSLLDSELELTAEQRSALSEILDDSWRLSRTLREERRASLRELRLMLEAEVVDREAFHRLTDRLGELEDELRIHRIEAFLAIQDRLSFPQREALAARRLAMARAGKDEASASCDAEVDAVCGGLEVGEGRIRCLFEARSELSVSCRQLLRERMRRASSREGSGR